MFLVSSPIPQYQSVLHLILQMDQFHPFSLDSFFIEFQLGELHDPACSHVFVITDEPPSLSAALYLNFIVQVVTILSGHCCLNS